MTVTITFTSPEEEAAFVAQARAEGLSVQEWLKELGRQSALRTQGRDTPQESVLATQPEHLPHTLQRDLTAGSATEDPLADQPVKVVSEMILRRVRTLAPEAFDGLPKDGASQHDHYIYGLPKREDL